MKILTVLRAGGDFTPAHVQALQRQARVHAPWADFQCLSDTPIERVEVIPLVHKWPGWWSKMEMFRPDIKGPFLYMDLDTVLAGSLDDILRVDNLTMLRDFYRDGKRRPAGLQSSLMYVPEAVRPAAWNLFSARPQEIMAAHARGGDQAFLEKHWGLDTRVWQECLPQQVVSFKVHCAVNRLGGGTVFRGIPDGARVVCFHGQPRPFDVPHFKELYL